MIAFDTNLLVYAHRGESPFHRRAAEVLRAVAEAREPWGLLWPCLHEFVGKVTHPGIFVTPTPVEAALHQVRIWTTAPTVAVLGEESGYWPVFETLVRTGQVKGSKVHDARIAALSLLHDLELYSADRDFSRFPKLRVRNPL